MTKTLKSITLMTIALLILILPVLSACQRAQKPTPQKRAKASEILEVNKPSIELDDILGKMDFSLLEDKTEKVIYEGQRINLSSTDSNGLVWTLTIPEGALIEDQTVEIAITPMQDIQNTQLPGKYTGLLLSPDGITFTKPATLTVEGAGAGNFLFFSGNHEGTGLNILPAESGEDVIKAEIYHFSSTYAGSSKMTRDEWISFFNKVFIACEALLKEEIKFDIPDIDFSYMEAADYKVILDTRVNFLNREIPMMQLLFMIPMKKDELVFKDEGLIEKAWNLFMATYDRYFEKIDTFLEEHRGTREQACIMVFLGAANIYNAYLPLAFGDFIDFSPTEAENLRKKMDETYNKYHEIAVTWAKETWDDTLKDLRDDHQYKYVLALYLIANDFGSHMHKEFNKSFLIREIENAMAFKLTYEGANTVKNYRAPVIWRYSGEANLEFKFEYNFGGDTGVKDFFWFSEGTYKWNGFESPENVRIDTASVEFDPDLILIPEKNKYELLLCFDSLHPDECTYIANGVRSASAPGHKYITSTIFKDYLDPDDPRIYFMILDLISGQKEIENKMTGNAAEVGKGECTITLTHAPIS